MDPFEVPEVHRVDLCGTVLALHSWGVRDAREFAWFEPPAADRIEAAQRLLTGLGALDRDTGRISEPGKRMLGLPVHPRLARLLMAAGAEGRLEQGAAVAALLSEKDLAVREPTAGPNPAQRRSRPASDAASPTSSRGSTGWPRPSMRGSRPRFEAGASIPSRLGRRPASATS